MSNKKYIVSEECIACRACVEVAEANFEINDSNIAYLKKQPENPNEKEMCNEALEICPVNAISIIENNLSGEEPILSKSNIKEVLDKYPELKPVLINLSPKFKKMQNPVMYNTLARFATFKDAAKITGVSVCELLHTMNKFLGIEDKLLKSMPECIYISKNEKEITGINIDWNENPERYIYNYDTMNELIEKISKLKAQENIVIISIQNPDEIIKLAHGLNFKFNIEKHKEYRVSIFNPKQPAENVSWEKRKNEFETLDLRNLNTDPFDVIIKKTREIQEGSGFVLVQKFKPTPIINMLSEMGFESITEEKSATEIRVYFHKKIKTKKIETSDNSKKVDVVIQSATPVAYPVIMRLLQSEKIRKSLNITELKVWEETEKHLGWIVNGKADISFSALITSVKLRATDVIIPALFVWDNFVILTRYEANELADLKGKQIHTPLFEEAPPAKITKYLIEANGLNADDFNFVYGTPFGRPEKIYTDFVTGIADTVILREPEASYAIKTMQDRNQKISVISYNKIWNEINPGFGSFPNAGIVIKGEFARKHPELIKTLLEELEISINMVNKHRKETANLSYDIMRQSVDKIELFLDRVNFNYVAGDKLIKKVKNYFDILTKQGIVDTKIDDDFLSIFKN